MERVLKEVAQMSSLYFKMVAHIAKSQTTLHRSSMGRVFNYAKKNTI